jgi:hypothetical protein
MRILEMRRVVRWSLMSMAAVSAGISEAWACPMCKLALETDDPQPRAYMISILFMLGMITAVCASVGVLLCWVSRQEQLALNAAGYQHLFENGATEAAAAQPH